MVFVAILALVLTAQTILAVGYGEGSFGEGKYGEGEGGGTTTTSSPNTTTSSSNSTTNGQCQDAVGTQPPWLYGAIAQDPHSVVLYFTEASSPTNKYVLAYGTKSGEYTYGAENLPLKIESRMTYAVKDLAPNTTYYFKVRGGNGCATGNWSNEISVTTKPSIVFNTLQLTTTKFESSSKSKGASPSAAPEMTEEQGYTVKIRVVDDQGQPVAGAKVTMHSKVQEATTDEEGNVVFNNVEEGDHKVIIDHKNYSGEQALHLSGDNNELSVEIKVTPQKILLSPVYLWSVGSLLVLVAVLSVALMMKKS